MEEAIQKFIRYLHKTKKASENTEVSYQRDLKKLEEFCHVRLKASSWAQVNATGLNAYVLYMERERYASSSISRSIASMRAFFRYLEKKGCIPENYAEELKPPKIEKKAPQILDMAEVDLLLRQPDTSTPKGLRDVAMLELLYATGMRVSELISLKLPDVNTTMCYVRCTDRKSERVIPFGKTARKALLAYLDKGRPVFVKNQSSECFFTNTNGRQMSRQGFWKVLKGYAAEAGIKKDITPHTLRHSFAAHMVQNGAELKSLQEMLGHSDISTTQMYVDISLNHMREVYARAHPRK